MKNYLGWLFCTIFLVSLQSNAQKRLPSIGLTGAYSNDSLVHAAGFTYIEETVKKMLSPDVSEETFSQQAAQLKHLQCKVQTCNVFVPSQIKLVGPEVNEEQVLAYVQAVMQRAKKAGIKLIVLGSGGARERPEGTSPEAAKQQFIKLCRKMAAVAARYDCIIAIENLNSTETNFINTLSEGNEVVTAVNHPNFKLTADIYHMLKENEPAANIEKAKRNLVHCHIAEKEKRTAPGVAGDDFRPYMAALNNIGYTGRIMMECRWESGDKAEMFKQYKQAFDYLSGQIKEVYK